MSDLFFRKEDEKNYSEQESQMIKSLQLHQSNMLSEIPLDVAITAMATAWFSFHEEYRDKKS